MPRQTRVVAARATVRALSRDAPGLAHVRVASGPGWRLSGSVARVPPRSDRGRLGRTNRIPESAQQSAARYRRSGLTSTPVFCQAGTDCHSLFGPPVAGHRTTRAPPLVGAGGEAGAQPV